MCVYAAGRLGSACCPVPALSEDDALLSALIPFAEVSATTGVLGLSLCAVIFGVWSCENKSSGFWHVCVRWKWRVGSARSWFYRCFRMMRRWVPWFLLARCGGHVFLVVSFGLRELFLFERMKTIWMGLDKLAVFLCVRLGWQGGKGRNRVGSDLGPAVWSQKETEGASWRKRAKETRGVKGSHKLLCACWMAICAVFAIAQEQRFLAYPVWAVGSSGFLAPNEGPDTPLPLPRQGLAFQAGRSVWKL